MRLGGELRRSDGQGDERVFQGPKIDAKVFFGDITGWGVETYAEKDDKINNL